MRRSQVLLLRVLWREATIPQRRHAAEYLRRLLHEQFRHPDHTPYQSILALEPGKPCKAFGMAKGLWLVTAGDPAKIEIFLEAIS